MKVALLPITESRKVAIIANQNDEYITDGSIRYRNIGEYFDHRIIHERFVHLTDSTVTVLNIKGDEDFHFPLAWLNPINGMIETLIQAKILQP